MELTIISIVLLALVYICTRVIFMAILERRYKREPFEPMVGVRKRINGVWVTEWKSAKNVVSGAWGDPRPQTIENIKANGKRLKTWRKAQ